MGNYWSTQTNPGFDDFLTEYPLCGDLKDFMEVQMGERIDTCTRDAALRAIVAWAQSQELYDDTKQCITCDSVLADVLNVENGTVVNYNQLQTALADYFKLPEIPTPPPPPPIKN